MAERPEEPPESGGSDDEQPPEQRLLANRLTITLIIFEVLIGIIGLVAGWYTEVDWAYHLRPELDAAVLGLAGGGALFGLNSILIFSWEKYNPLYRWVYKPFAEALLEPLKMLSFEDTVYISVLSGVAEELLFRGWLLTSFENVWVGLVVSSLLFGLIHVWDRQGIGYGFYATAMGAMLGLLFIYTGNLWAPILAHVINNLFSMNAMKYGFTPEP